jgi:hypothetical protein
MVMNSDFKVDLLFAVCGKHLKFHAHTQDFNIFKEKRGKNSSLQYCVCD